MSHFKNYKTSDEAEYALVESILLIKNPPPPVTPSVTPQPEVIQVR